MNTDIPERVRVEDFEDDDQSFLERVGIESYPEDDEYLNDLARRWVEGIAPTDGSNFDSGIISIGDVDGNIATISATSMNHPTVNILELTISSMEENMHEQARRIEQLEEKIRRLENGTL